MKDLMYAVIATGGKQEKVETGQVLNVELLHADEGSEVTFTPILLVADDAVMSTNCLLYTSPSPRDRQKSRMPSSA